MAEDKQIEEIDLAGATTFDEVESRFLGAVTDDMYVSLNKSDTEEILDEVLIEALPWFRTPRGKNILDYDREGRKFKCYLDELEIQIIVKYMTMVWVQRQLFTIDLIKQKYTGSDFSVSSQANHIGKLITLKQEAEREGDHLQSNYYRYEKDEHGVYRTTLYKLLERPRWK